MSLIASTGSAQPVTCTASCDAVVVTRHASSQPDAGPPCSFAACRRSRAALQSQIHAARDACRRIAVAVVAAAAAEPGAAAVGADGAMRNSEVSAAARAAIAALDASTYAGKHTLLNPTGSGSSSREGLLAMDTVGNTCIVAGP